MATDGLGNISNEQLMAMSMMSNGQITNDSISTSNTSDQTNLAFQLLMKNLMESSKNSNTVDSNSTTSGETKVEQQYPAGQNLEDIAMILNNYRVNKNRDITTNRNPEDMSKIYSAVEKASKTYGVDQNLILAIIKQESDFDSSITSSAGAAGLMQVMPENFAHTNISDGYDVNQNVNGGTKLLKEYLDKYNGNVEMALMAYNGGPGTMQRRGVSSTDDLYKMPKETQHYVPKVMGYYKNGI